MFSWWTKDGATLLLWYQRRADPLVEKTAGLKGSWHKGLVKSVSPPLLPGLPALTTPFFRKLGGANGRPSNFENFWARVFVLQLM